MALPRALSILVAFSLTLAVQGCGGADTPAQAGLQTVQFPQAGTSADIPPATEAEPAPITLDRGDAEVWTWQKTLTGACPVAGEDTTIWLRVNDTDVPAARQGDRFSADVPLGEGENHITAHCRLADGAEHHSEAVTLTQRLQRRPTARISIFLKPNGILLDGRQSAPCEAGGATITGYHWLARKGNPAPLILRRPDDVLTDKTLLLEYPKPDGEYYCILRVTDAEGRSDTASAYFVMEDGKARVPDWKTENAAWIESAVIYGVVPHNFGPEGFRSVTERLDSLQDLGVTALWLAPSTLTRSHGHGYSVLDYFTLRPDYGTDADFHQVVTEAHARGIRVLMDFVPNHTSHRHRYMQDAIEHGTASPYWDFYDRDPETGEYTYYFNWHRLPNLNFENPEVRRWIMEAFSSWVREFDIDGFRVDVSWGIKLRRPDFWMEWREHLKRIKPDALLIAESTAREGWYYDNGFDAGYDWTDELGHWSMEKAFDDPDQIVPRLHQALTNDGRGFHEDALVFRFLNNNDTGERFITRHGRDTTMVAAAMLLTLPGLPCIYTGQEVGAEFEPYRTSQPISWGDFRGLRDQYRKLVHLRRHNPSLHSRQWDLLEAKSDQQLLAYARYGQAGDAPALVVLNYSRQPATADIPLPNRAAAFARPAELHDLITGQPIPIVRPNQSTIRLSLPALSALILAPPEG